MNTLPVKPSLNAENIVQHLEYALGKDAPSETKLAEIMALLATHPILEVRQEPEDTLVRRVMRYIEDHYLEPLSLEIIAKVFHRAPAHLTTQFRKATGHPVMDCVLEKRMSEAKELLMSTNKTVQAIAEHVGYGDVTLFSRQFRRRYGVSPRQWRENEKKAKSGENQALRTLQANT